MINNIFTPLKQGLDTSLEIEDEPKIDLLATSIRKQQLKSTKIIDQEQIPIISKQERFQQDYV